MRKDTRFTIKISRNGSLIGVSEIIIGQLLFIKREENYAKTVTIAMTESVKKSLFGNAVTNTWLKISVKGKLTYSDQALTQPNQGGRSSSCKPMPAKTSISNQNGNKYKLSVVNNSPGKGKCNRPSCIPGPEPVPNLDISLSKVDSLFEENHLDEFENIEKSLNEFVVEFNNYVKTEDSESFEKAKNIIMKLFELQRIYYGQFNRAVQTNRHLKELLVKYNEKYRTFFKKTNRLKEALESNTIKNTNTSLVNKEENKRIIEVLKINKAELEMYKLLFRLVYTDYDLRKFKEEKELNNGETEKKSLLKAIEILAKDPKKIEKIPQEKRIYFSYICSKYGINFEEQINSAPQEGVNRQSLGVQNGPQSGVPNYENVNKMTLDDDDDTTPSPVENKNSIAGQQPQKKKLSIVESSVADHTDQKIDNFLVDFYAKKRMSQVPFRRLSEGNYEFGTQKVMIKVEGETIRGILFIFNFISKKRRWLYLT